MWYRISEPSTSRRRNNMRLHNKVAIVTGVSQPGQVGYALAAAFAREGALLAISARNAERVNQRTQELRSERASVIAIPADLTTEEGADTHPGDVGRLWAHQRARQSGRWSHE